MSITGEMFVFGIFVGIIFFGLLVVLAIIINNHWGNAALSIIQNEENRSQPFSPLAWATTFFSLWYTLLSIHYDQAFGWICFVAAIILLSLAYLYRIRKRLSTSTFVNRMLPIIYMATIATFIFGVLLALKDLSNVERMIALSYTCVILGTYLAVEISQVNDIVLRIIGCIITFILIIIAFIFRFSSFGFWENWPLILIAVLCLWATMDPNRFKDMPLV